MLLLHNIPSKRESPPVDFSDFHMDTVIGAKNAYEAAFKNDSTIDFEEIITQVMSATPDSLNYDDHKVTIDYDAYSIELYPATTGMPETVNNLYVVIRGGDNPIRRYGTGWNEPRREGFTRAVLSRIRDTNRVLKIDQYRANPGVNTDEPTIRHQFMVPQ